MEGDEKGGREGKMKGWWQLQGRGRMESEGIDSARDGQCAYV